MAIRITVAEPITVQAVASICGSYFCLSTAVGAVALELDGAQPRRTLANGHLGPAEPLG